MGVPGKSLFNSIFGVDSVGMAGECYMLTTGYAIFFLSPGLVRWGRVEGRIRANISLFS